MSGKKGDEQRGETADSIARPSKDHHSEERRKALKKILMGGGIAAGSAMLPDKWTRPVIDAIIAPAHAQGSVTTTPDPV